MDGRGVLIAGAGPTGLLAAILLAQRGVKSVVLEQRPEPYRLPRAVHLDDEAVRILQEAGLADDFAAISRPALGLRVLDAQHRVLAEFSRSAAVGVHGHPPANLFDQPDLENLLRARAEQFGSIDVRLGWTVAGLQDRRVRALDPAGQPHEFAVDAVLGCDGAASTVRGLIRSPLRDLHFRERWLVVDARSHRDLGTWNGVHQICDPARAATYMQVADDRYRWEFRLLDGESAPEISGSGQLAELLRPWTGGGDDIEVFRSAEYTFRAQLATRWQDGRVFLLGDAAHQTPPFIGQGLGAGLRDVANLSWKLAAVLNGGASDELVATYPAERIPHARSTIRTARLLGWAMTGGQDAAAALRRAVLALVMRVPGATAVLDRGSPRLRPGPLVARGAGGLTPQPAVGGRRLDELLGPGFAVLTPGPLSAELAEVATRLEARTVTAPWLKRAEVVRPDRVVMARADRHGRLTRSGRRTLRTCADLLRPPGATPNTG